MVIDANWNLTYRCISSVYPAVGIYDRIAASHADFAAAVELEALTNPRVREEAGDLRKIRSADFISGKNTAPVIASFVYSGPSRFTDGRYGVYYAALQEETAIAESIYHTEKRLREWHEPSIDIDKRIYTAAIKGAFDDVRGKGTRAKIYDRIDYTASQAYARKLYEANSVDGIVYQSVRKSGGECVAAFRPRSISACRVWKHMQFRWDGSRIVGTAYLSDLRTYKQ
ncbi:MAG: RES family NAD+ phosphorylase [Vulcanimicrobiaceae bacterium]